MGALGYSNPDGSAQEIRRGVYRVFISPNGSPRQLEVYASGPSSAIDDAWIMIEKAWTQEAGGRLGKAFGTIAVNALPLGAGKWLVSFASLQGGPCAFEVSAPSPGAAVKAGWEEVRKARMEEERRKRWR